MRTRINAALLHNTPPNRAARPRDADQGCYQGLHSTPGGSQVSAHLIALTGCIYAYVCLEQLWRGNVPMAVAYAGYAFANIGLWLLASR